MRMIIVEKNFGVRCPSLLSSSLLSSLLLSSSLTVRIFIFFSRTTGPISTKFVRMKSPPFFKGDNNGKAKSIDEIKSHLLQNY